MKTKVVTVALRPKLLQSLFNASQREAIHLRQPLTP